MATDFEMTVLTALGDLKASQEKHFGEVKSEQASLTVKIEALSGPTGRVTALESAAKRQFWYSMGIAPALAVAHGIARKFGVNI